MREVKVIMDEFTVHDALRLAVTTEEIGAKVYRRFAEKFADQHELAEIFAKLARDEQLHQAQFRALLDQHPRTNEELGRYGVDEYLRATAISEFFGKKAVDRLKEAQDPEEALKNAVGLEKATLLFYQAIRDTIGESPALDEIIQIERSHLTTLMKVILTDARFRGLSDRW
jgi:rubrerythrin